MSWIFVLFVGFVNDIKIDAQRDYPGVTIQVTGILALCAGADQYNRPFSTWSRIICQINQYICYLSWCLAWVLYLSFFYSRTKYQSIVLIEQNNHMDTKPFCFYKNDKALLKMLDEGLEPIWSSAQVPAFGGFQDGGHLQELLSVLAILLLLLEGGICQ